MADACLGLIKKQGDNFTVTCCLLGECGPFKTPLKPLVINKWVSDVLLNVYVEYYKNVIALDQTNLTRSY